MCELLYIYCIITDTMEQIKSKTKHTLYLKSDKGDPDIRYLRFYCMAEGKMDTML
jgi:hypothetical protein